MVFASEEIQFEEGLPQVNYTSGKTALFKTSVPTPNDNDGRIEANSSEAIKTHQQSQTQSKSAKV